MERVSFVNFTGIDRCGHSNAAINNLAAGIVEGNEGLEFVHGSATCYPTHTAELDFPHTPVGRGRITLHDGDAGRGHSRCYVIDRDGTLLDQPTNRGWVLRSSLPYWWDPDIIEDCEAYAENYDDDPDFSTCPWFVRDNEFLLDAACDPERRGTPYNSAKMNNLNNCTNPALAFGPAEQSQDWSEANTWVCPGVDFLNLRFLVPSLIVSGSPVLYAPVLWSTVRDRSTLTRNYDGDETVSVLQESLSKISTHALNRFPQPYTVVVANQQNYRVDFTGDVSDPRFFDNGDMEFNIFEAQGTDMAGTTARPPLHCESWGKNGKCDLDDWAVIVNFKFLNPAKVLFYHNYLKVDGATRLDQVTRDQPSGFGYFHPVSKVASFVVKGPGVVKMRALQVSGVLCSRRSTIVCSHQIFKPDTIALSRVIATMAHTVLCCTGRAGHSRHRGDFRLVLC